jgi:carboxymethylenebutenolidase
VKQFEANMKQAGKKLTYKIYPAEHVFANPSHPKYHPEFTAETHQRGGRIFFAKV